MKPILLLFIPLVEAFTTCPPLPNQQSSRISRSSQQIYATANTQQISKSTPREGFTQQLLNIALKSPLWEYVLVPQARASIVKTAEDNGIPWVDAKDWIRKQEDTPWSAGEDDNNNHKYDSIDYPEYYRQSFHAYSEGNLSYDAAFEQELASRSIGARNFPQYASKGEDVFRDAFDQALYKLGASCDDEGTIVDCGCGTGTSTRRLANLYPQAKQLIGIDLSPYFIDVGQTLLRLSPTAIDVNSNSKEGWITNIESDERIQLRRGDISSTELASNSVSVVNLSLVLHELPLYAAKEVVLEAHRILKQGGQLWISEMDFESQAYKAQRENAALFSLLRATEPFLDEYADGTAELRSFILQQFDVVKITAATGRHYALLAEKNDTKTSSQKKIEDSRFNEDGSYAIEDTHLLPWESAKQ